MGPRFYSIISFFHIKIQVFLRMPILPILKIDAHGVNLYYTNYKLGYAIQVDIFEFVKIYKTHILIVEDRKLMTDLIVLIYI